MFTVIPTKLWTSAIVVGIAAVLLYSQTSSLEAGQPAKQGMIATTKNAVWHLENGRLRYCVIRSAEIVCVEEK